MLMFQIIDRSMGIADVIILLILLLHLNHLILVIIGILIILSSLASSSRRGLNQQTLCRLPLLFKEQRRGPARSHDQLQKRRQNVSVRSSDPAAIDLLLD